MPLAARALAGSGRSNWPFPLDQRRSFTTYSGTAALHQAGIVLGLRPDSVVLAPSYNCGHELEPFLRLGLRIRCYRVDADMRIDPEDIAARIDGDVSAVLVTHYFGFDQELGAIRALCDRHGIRLIEDCAHALFSDNAAGTLGRVGDVAAYSMRKSLPLPHGGCVLVNDTSLGMPALSAPPATNTFLKGSELVRKAALRGAGRGFSPVTALQIGAALPLTAAAMLVRQVKGANALESYDPDDEIYDFDSRVLSWGAAEFTLNLISRIDWRGIAAIRRRNYEFLAGGLRGFAWLRVLRPQVGAHTSPLFLPVALERRTETFDFLARNRIYPGIWWEEEHPSVDWSAFPEARRLKQTVLALPVHQDLDQADIGRVIEVLRNAPGAG